MEMAPFLYPRKETHRLPHSQAHDSIHHHAHTVTSSPHLSELDPQSDPGAADLSTYSHKMRRWTMCQLRRSTAIPPYKLDTSNISYTPDPSPTYTKSVIVSPLYPTSSSLYPYSMATPGPSQEQDEGGAEDRAEVGTTPSNTPRNMGLKRRSTVAATKAKRARDEVPREEEKQARLRPVKLIRSLSCAA